MATFKVTILVDDGLSLGSILMTKHVELLHIAEISHVAAHMEKSNIDYGQNVKLIEAVKSNKRAKAQKERFSHPSGKRVQDFIIEFMEERPNKIAMWKDLAKHIQATGFERSSINNGISRLLKNKIIKREGTGKYKLIKTSALSQKVSHQE
jgi:hypothetical protein